MTPFVRVRRMPASACFELIDCAGAVTDSASAPSSVHARRRYCAYRNAALGENAHDPADMLRRCSVQTSVDRPDESLVAFRSTPPNSGASPSGVSAVKLKARRVSYAVRVTLDPTCAAQRFLV